MGKETTGIKIIALNKKASFNYFLSDFLECGIALVGTEIKSLRVHGASLVDSYVVVRGGELEVINMHINPYDHGNIFNHDETRERKLLLHKNEILKIDHNVTTNRYTLIPLRLYFKKNKVNIWYNDRKVVFLRPI